MKNYACKHDVNLNGIKKKMWQNTTRSRQLCDTNTTEKGQSAPRFYFKNIFNSFGRI